MLVTSPGAWVGMALGLGVVYTILNFSWWLTIFDPLFVPWYITLPVMGGIVTLGWLKKKRLTPAEPDSEQMFPPSHKETS